MNNYVFVNYFLCWQFIIRSQGLLCVAVNSLRDYYVLLSCCQAVRSQGLLCVAVNSLRDYYVLLSWCQAVRSQGLLCVAVMLSIRNAWISKFTTYTVYWRPTVYSIRYTVYWRTTVYSIRYTVYWRTTVYSIWYTVYAWEILITVSRPRCLWSHTCMYKHRAWCIVTWHVWLTLNQFSYI